MRIALVAMPWAMMNSPSAALGILAAVVRERNPEHHVDCIYSYVESYIKLGTIYDLIANDRAMGEIISASFLYPENIVAIRTLFDEWATKNTIQDDCMVGKEGIFSFVQSCLEDYLAGVIKDLSEGDYEVVAFTTCYSQLFMSLFVAQQVKSASPKTRIVFGGSAVSILSGESIMDLYPYIDFVVKGEGERRFLDLLIGIEGRASDYQYMEGIVENGTFRSHLLKESRQLDTPRLSEIENLDELPYPDYREYVELATKYSIEWRIPVEASRGCWWDRSIHTGNPLKACYFCGLNSCTYREKSPLRFADEVAELSRRYHNVRIRLVDNVTRKRGIKEVADALISKDIDFDTYNEVRANIAPADVQRQLEIPGDDN